MLDTVKSDSARRAQVSVVIVNFNAGDMLLGCVATALKQARQVVVVDNASTDDSMENLKSIFGGTANLQIIYNADNTGFAAGCNQGIKFCAEQHILFLNPDCILEPGSLRRMVQTLEANSNCGMVGGLLFGEDGVEQGGGRRAVPTPWRSFVRVFGLARFAKRWPKLFDDFHLHKQPLPQKPIQVEAISGALMLVRKQALGEIGLWDEGYFLHCEDLDLCMRFRQKGWDVLFDPGAPAVHIHGTCSKSRPVFVEWHKHKGMVRFYRKFFRHQYPGVLMWLVALGVWIRFALVAVIKTFTKNDRQESYSKKDFEALKTAALRSAAAHEDDLNQKQLRVVGVVGATSMVGIALLPMLAQAGTKVVAYSRTLTASQVRNQDKIEWRAMSSLLDEEADENITDWIWVAPIKALPQQLALLKRAGAQHIVALSTTSRFTKKSSSSAAEREFVEELIAAEEALQACGKENAITWTILRPTLIYGFGLDKNIGVIAKFIRRFHFFPILGKASGLRQPIHARDVAAACKTALESSSANNRAYNISGAEILTYRMMVTRIFEALLIRPRFLSIPLWMFSAGVAIVRMVPGYGSWSSAMAERMNQDMIFDHEDATRDFGFMPQAFSLDAKDLPAADTAK